MNSHDFSLFDRDIPRRRLTDERGFALHLDPQPAPKANSWRFVPSLHRLGLPSVRTMNVLWLAALVTLFLACGDRSQATRGAAGVEKGRPSSGATVAHADEHHETSGESAQGGHEKEAEDPHPGGEKGEDGERSDLDIPTAELMALKCEHGTHTYECDTCRYEVGVVKVASSLISEGLIKLEKVGKRQAETTIPLTGEVSFDQRRITHLSPQTEGIIRTAFVELGQQVARGQVLFEVDSQALGQARGEYLEAKALLRLARQTHDRQARLKAQQVTSEREFLEAQQALEAAEIRARSTAENLVRLGLQPAEVEKLREGAAGQARGRLAVTAPFAGTVLQLHAVAGEAAAPGESIVQIGDLSSLWIWADLYERDLAEVESHRAQGALRALISVKAFPGVAFPGKVDLVDATMDPTSRTVKVRISVPNPDRRLRAGMFANVRLQVPSPEVVVAVSRGAVLEDEGRSFVFVHQLGDYFLRRPVSVGRDFGEQVEIKAGLVGGETVVGDGCFLLKADVLRSKMGAGCAD